MNDCTKLIHSLANACETNGWAEEIFAFGEGLSYVSIKKDEKKVVLAGSNGVRGIFFADEIPVLPEEILSACLSGEFTFEESAPETMVNIHPLEAIQTLASAKGEAK